MTSERIQWSTESAIVLRNREYEAVIIPDAGANCISLVHLPSGDQLLRVPENGRKLREGSNVFGLPLLFPPNRVRDGRFLFHGREYRFPINEPERNNHIHGFLHRTPFAWAGEGTFVYSADADHPYLSFPYPFTVERRYTLSAQGLCCTVRIVNGSGQPMPCGLGIHAALGLHRDSACSLKIPVIRQWLVDPARLLPTGQTLEHSRLLDALRAGSLDPDREPISALLECAPGSEVSLRKPQGVWKCRMDKSFRFVMLWNGGGGRHFVCPEPQSWITDAPNLCMHAETSGLLEIQPGETLQTELSYTFIPN